MEKHYCSCPVVNCPRHPSNHSEGCDPCVKDNLEQGRMPACFFLLVSEDMSGVDDYSIESFAAHFQRHCDEYRKKRRK